MNHAEILQAAKEAGATSPITATYQLQDEQIIRFAAIIEKIIEKRTIERCAAECDYVSKNARPSTVSYAYKTGADECAAAIRKLGEQE